MTMKVEENAVSLGRNRLYLEEKWDSRVDSNHSPFGLQPVPLMKIHPFRNIPPINGQYIGVDLGAVA